MGAREARPDFPPGEDQFDRIITAWTDALSAALDPFIPDGKRLKVKMLVYTEDDNGEA